MALITSETTLSNRDWSRKTGVNGFVSIYACCWRGTIWFISTARSLVCGWSATSWKVGPAESAVISNPILFLPARTKSIIFASCDGLKWCHGSGLMCWARLKESRMLSGSCVQTCGVWLGELTRVICGLADSKSVQSHVRISGQLSLEYDITHTSLRWTVGID